MFGRQTGPTIPTTTPPTAQPPTASASLLQTDVAHATAPPPDSGYSTPSPLTSALGNNPTTTATIHLSTDPGSFRSLLGSHCAVVVMFTSVTYAPCRMIEPVFEELARAKGVPRVAFLKVGLIVGMGSMVSREHGVTATPTFGFSWIRMRRNWVRRSICFCTGIPSYVDS